MGQVTTRTRLTSRGRFAISPWGIAYDSYWYDQINKGNNSISRLEVVSALNSFNLAMYQYHYNQADCPSKYNPKIYLSAFQTASTNWFLEQNTGCEKYEKSGSWPINHNVNLTILYIFFQALN